MVVLSHNTLRTKNTEKKNHLRFHILTAKADGVSCHIY